MSHAYLGAPSIIVVQRCGKIPFRTQQAALRKIKKMAKFPHIKLPHIEIESTSGRINAYKCHTCPETWHIGHSDKKRLRVSDGDGGGEYQ